MQYLQINIYNKPKFYGEIELKNKSTNDKKCKPLLYHIDPNTIQMVCFPRSALLIGCGKVYYS